MFIGRAHLLRLYFLRNRIQVLRDIFPRQFRFGFHGDRRHIVLRPGGNCYRHRKEKALRYRKEEDQVRSAVASLLMGTVGELDSLQIAPGGKPFFSDGPFFNVSHGGEFIGIYVADAPVGLDIEL